MNRKVLHFIILFLIASLDAHATKSDGRPTYGRDLYNQLKYPPDFKHFDYVNPEAPKGGTLRLSAIGTYDSLNPFIIKGTAAAGMQLLHPSYLFATLLDHSRDEPNSAYGYIAESITVSEDKRVISFKIRASAKFHDESPITARDVVFTFNTLVKHGNPLYRNYYRDIEKVVARTSDTVDFYNSKPDNNELPIILGELPILSEKYFESHEFNKSGLTPILGSGPYKIKEFDAGKSITYERVKDWWGEKIPVNVGEYNFDEIKITYFLDQTVALEAFKAGEIDLRLESSAKTWKNEYNTPALKRGDIIKLELRHEQTQGMQGFIFNLRRQLFQDIRVRKALAYALDFEWSNQHLFYSQYVRSNSYFNNSDLGSRALPEGEELEILNRFRSELPEDLFTKPFLMPVHSGKVTIRNSLQQAREWLKAAGWEIKEGVLRNNNTNEPFQIEILIALPDYARIFNPYIQNLKKLGIEAKLRVADSSQYLERVENYDFDMILGGFAQSESPGNEQADFWGSKAADLKGSQNTAGIKNSVVDALVDLIKDADDRQTLVSATRALDRVLLWNFYVVPGYYRNFYPLAYWNRFGLPQVMPKYGFDLDAWWIDAQKDAKIKRSA